MSENAEEKVATKKRAAKKATKKAVAKKPAAKKAVKKTAPEAAPKKRGRPAGKKVAKKATSKRPANGRRRKPAKQFAYLLQTTQEDGSTKNGSINGPFATESDALDDASIMADDNTTIVLFRETKRGKVQKSTKFVAGR